MIALRRLRWFGGLLIAPVLAFAFATSGYVALRCSVTGLVTLDACCASAPGGESLQQAAAHASLSEPFCCERLTVANAKAPAAVSEQPSERPLLPVACSAPSAVAVNAIAPPSRARSAHLAEPPPPIAASRFLLTHAFLI